MFLLSLSTASFADNYFDNRLEAEISAALVTVEVDVSSIDPGTFVEVDYAGSSIGVYKRTAEDLKYLQRPESSHWMNSKRDDISNTTIKKLPSSTAGYLSLRLRLVDQLALDKTTLRSKRDDIFVFYAHSTYLGCLLKIAPLVKETHAVGATFESPCFNINYDSAGRHIPADSLAEPKYEDLNIPPHRFEGENTLIIGLRDISYLPELKFSLDDAYADMSHEEKLSMAARHNDIDAVRQALKSGADTTLVLLPKISPFDSAILGGSIEVIELLVANGVRPTPRSLNLASYMKRDNVVDLIESLNE